MSLGVLVLAFPLGGCFSLTAQKPVPDWAMAQSGEAQVAQSRQRASRVAAQRRVVATDRTGSFEMPTNTGNVAMSIDERPRPAPQPGTRGGPTNFSPEWYAQEKAADERLRRSMNICTGC